MQPGSSSNTRARTPNPTSNQNPPSCERLLILPHKFLYLCPSGNCNYSNGPGWLLWTRLHSQSSPRGLAFLTPLQIRSRLHGNVLVMLLVISRPGQRCQRLETLQTLTCFPILLRCLCECLGDALGDVTRNLLHLLVLLHTARHKACTRDDQ